MDLTGKIVEVGTPDMTYTGKLMEMGETEIHLETEMGWVVIPSGNVVYLRELEPGE
ncbi:MAG: hypothetical protein M0018_12230 [Nitrospiraceae bacterium]|nr:hypothetical protein [Nitrospiraceae bacterium]